MADGKILEERLKTIELEMATLTDRCEKIGKSLSELEDLKHEIKAFKLFIGRRHPEFKKEFIELFEKARSGSH